MRVRRLGRVFGAEMGPRWMASHAAYPTPMLMGAGPLRVFFCCRDPDNRGMLAWIDVEPDDPTRVLSVSPEPCLVAGERGAFDDRGISVGSIHLVGNELWLYYMGWNKSADVPFRNAIGLAVAKDGHGERFERSH